MNKQHINFKVEMKTKVNQWKDIETRLYLQFQIFYFHFLKITAT